MRRAVIALALAGCLPPITPPSTTAPKIASVSPTDGATGVPLAVAPTLCFDQPLDPLTVTASAFVLERAQGKSHPHVPATVALDASGACAILTPAGPLAPTSRYEVSVTDAAHAQSGLSLAHPPGQRIVFTASFTTAGAPTRASLLAPADGALAAPLDLATVEVTFSRRVSSTAPPLALTPEGGPSALDPSGRLATIEPPPLSPGELVALALDPGLRDPDGDPPLTADALGFTVGQCAEGSPPSVGGGTAIPRDTDALLLFLVDRPSLCAATVSEAGCPDAGAIPVPALCTSPYDPCVGGLLCRCAVPLVGLCPGGDAEATPEATGWNGQVGSAGGPSDFTLSPPLPRLVLSELMLQPTGSRAPGEYVEVVNLDDGPEDLLGISLASCAGSVG
ncbi:MAG: Ig-like domain-containing domain, partial [Deltaproteobacteria bacterium]